MSEELAQSNADLAALEALAAAKRQALEDSQAAIADCTARLVEANDRARRSLVRTRGGLVDDRDALLAELDLITERRNSVRLRIATLTVELAAQTAEKCRRAFSQAAAALEQARAGARSVVGVITKERIEQQSQAAALEKRREGEFELAKQEYNGAQAALQQAQNRLIALQRELGIETDQDRADRASRETNTPKTGVIETIDVCPVCRKEYSSPLKNPFAFVQDVLGNRPGPVGVVCRRCGSWAIRQRAGNERVGDGRGEPVIEGDDITSRQKQGAPKLAG